MARPGLFSLKLMIHKLGLNDEFWKDRGQEIQKPALAIKFLNFPTFVVISNHLPTLKYLVEHRISSIEVKRSPSGFISIKTGKFTMFNMQLPDL
jgi:hypothetical protein